MGQGDEQIESISESAKRTMAHQAETIRKLRETLNRAAYVAEHLHAMIDRETWRATGGDDMQGHYEGDYHAEQVLREIREWQDV